jgi:hypothetical protein
VFLLLRGFLRYVRIYIPSLPSFLSFSVYLLPFPDTLFLTHNNQFSLGIPLVTLSPAARAQRIFITAAFVNNNDLIFICAKEFFSRQSHSAISRRLFR